MNNSISLPDDSRRYSVTVEHHEIRCAHTSLSFAHATLIAALLGTALAAAILVYVVYIVPATGFDTSLSILGHVVGVLFSLILWAMLAHRFLEELLFVECRIYATDSSIFVEQRWIGGWHCTRKLDRPVEFQVQLDPETNVRSVLVEIRFVLQEHRSTQRHFGRSAKWIQPIPSAFNVWIPQEETFAKGWEPSQDEMIRLCAPFAQAMASELSVPIAYMLTGGHVLQQVDAV